MTQAVDTETLLFLATDLSRLLRAAIARDIAESDIGLTIAEARTLTFVARMDCPSQAQLAGLMGIDPMTVSGYLDVLEARELIVRRSHPKDRRVKRVDLTHKAKPVLAYLKKWIDEIEDRACRGINCAERRKIIELLCEARSNLMADMAPDDIAECPR